MSRSIFRACKTHFVPLFSRSVQCKTNQHILNYSKGLRYCKKYNTVKQIQNPNKGFGNVLKTAAAAIAGLFAVYGICHVVNEPKITQRFTVHASEDKKSEKKDKKKKDKKKKDKKKKDKEKHGGKGSKKLSEAIERSRDLCQRIKVMMDLPRKDLLCMPQVDSIA